MARDYTEEMCKEEEKTEQSHWLTVVKLFDYYNDECSLTVVNEKGEDVLSIDTESHGCVGLDKKLAKEMGELLLHWSQTGELRVPERSK